MDSDGINGFIERIHFDAEMQGIEMGLKHFHRCFNNGLLKSIDFETMDTLIRYSLNAVWTANETVSVSLTIGTMVWLNGSTDSIEVNTD